MVLADISWIAFLPTTIAVILNDSNAPPDIDKLFPDAGQARLPAVGPSSSPWQRSPANGRCGALAVWLLHPLLSVSYWRFPAHAERANRLKLAGTSHSGVIRRAVLGRLVHSAAVNLGEGYLLENEVLLQISCHSSGSERDLSQPAKANAKAISANAPQREANSQAET